MKSNRWVTGREILSDPKRSFTTDSFFKAIQDGDLIPYRETRPTLYPDPEVPKGREPLYPTLDLEKKYHKLAWYRYQKKWLIDNKSELGKDGRITTKRAEEKIAGLTQEIEGLNKVLAPGKVWNFPLDLHHQKLLLDALYLPKIPKPLRIKSNRQLAKEAVIEEMKKLIKEYHKVSYEKLIYMKRPGEKSIPEIYKSFGVEMPTSGTIERFCTGIKKKK